MKNYTHLLFDLDGTLTDPALGITNSIMYALKRFNIEVKDRKELYCLIGPPLIPAFESMWGLSHEDAVLALEYYREYFSVKGLFENVLYDGIDDLLDSLTKSGKKLYLATSKPEEYARKILEHFKIDRYFTFVAGNTLTESRPTKLAVLEYLMQTIPEINSDNTVMIGDTKYDAIGARDAGFDCIGVLYGYGKKEDFESLCVKKLAATVKELKGILLKGENL